MPVRPGYYLYMGSAFGPGGLRGRLSHHFAPPASPYWHIDYLRQAAELLEVWHTDDPVKREHVWARALCKHPQCSIPAPRFGASDCRCPAHLVYMEARPSMAWFIDLLQATEYTFRSMGRKPSCDGW